MLTGGKRGVQSRGDGWGDGGILVLSVISIVTSFTVMHTVIK